MLIEKGLIEYIDGERTFKTTEKGMNFLLIHKRVNGFILDVPSAHRIKENLSIL
jgi:predicted transcriptional regulator